MPREFGIEEGESSFHDCRGVDAVGVFEVRHIWEREVLGRELLRYLLLFDFLLFCLLLFVFLLLFLPMRREEKEASFPDRVFQ